MLHLRSVLPPTLASCLNQQLEAAEELVLSGRARSLETSSLNHLRLQNVRGTKKRPLLPQDDGKLKKLFVYPN